jgi:hypothetical protein
MLIRNLTVAECRGELERTGVGRLAFVRDCTPHIVPMRFSYDGSDLYGFSILGQKIEGMRENPLVCVEFDDRTNHFQWMSVIATGVYEELPMWWQPATVVTEPGNAFLPIFFRIRIKSMTGHQAAPDPCEASQLVGRKSAAVRPGSFRNFLRDIVHISIRGAQRPKH